MTDDAWRATNRQYVEARLRWLRLLLRREAARVRAGREGDPLGDYAGLVISDQQAERLLRGPGTVPPADPTRLGEAIAQAEREAASLGRAMRDVGAPAALDALAARLRLSPFEHDVLLLALAPHADPAFERLYAYVQDDVNRKLPTPHLALALLAPEGPAREAARDALLPGATLRALRVVTLADDPVLPPASRCLRLDEDVAARILGSPPADEATAHLLRPVPPVPLAGAQADLAKRLSAWRDAPGALNLVAAPGTGRRAVARAALGRLAELDLRRLPADPAQRQEALRLVRRALHLDDAYAFVDASDVDAADRAGVALVREAADSLQGRLVLATRDRSPAAALSVAVPRAPARDQRDLWEAALAPCDAAMRASLGALVEQFDLGPEAIARAAREADVRARLRGAERAQPRDAWDACREQAGPSLDRLAQRIPPGFTWSDLVLPDETLRQVQEIASQLEHRYRVYEEWGFGARLARGRGISVLFAGPSGTGKTMAAEVLAAHLGLDLYRIDLASVVSKYVGETEKNVRAVFEAAEASGAILFFDEADALFGKRTEVKDSHDRYANIEIDYLLQRMEEYRGLAILATNRKTDLDRAFLRRLRFLVEFPLPDAAARRRLWQKAFPREAERRDVDVEALSRLEVPGGNIRNIAVNAAFLAAAEGSPITHAHVMHAARREYQKIERQVSETEFGAWANARNGHAVTLRARGGP